MAVRQLKKNQRGAFCSHCDQRATHRGVMFKRFACADHMRDLKMEDLIHETRELNGYLTDAEDQLKYV